MAEESGGDTLHAALLRIQTEIFKDVDDAEDLLRNPTFLAKALVENCRNRNNNSGNGNIIDGVDVIEHAQDDDDDDGEEDDDDDDDDNDISRYSRRPPIELSSIKKPQSPSHSRRSMLFIVGALQFLRQVRQELEEMLLVESAICEVRTMGKQRRSPGQPTIHRSSESTTSCGQCQRDFTAFVRSRLCHSCGYSMCFKCSTKTYVLPQSFGYGVRPVRVCDCCFTWFQQAVEKYWGAIQKVRTLYDDDAIDISKLDSTSPCSNILKTPWSAVDKNEFLVDSTFGGKEIIQGNNIVNGTKLENSQKSLLNESSEGEETYEEEEIDGEVDLLHPLSITNVQYQNQESEDRNGRRTHPSTRSASFDITNLPRLSSTPPGRGAEKGGYPRQCQCFDDSDIVDLLKKEPEKPEIGWTADRPATILRFAVYELGVKDSLRRTLGFGKKNAVLDRFTVEIDVPRGVVRMKSVFMHRFFSFQCDAVRDINFGTDTTTARIKISCQEQADGRIIELQFASEDERMQFKKAIMMCTAALDDIRASRSERKADIDEGNKTVDLDQSRASYMNAIANTIIRSDYIAPCSPQYYPGERSVDIGEISSTLLIGPGDDSIENSSIWGRIRGKISVTNFRVLFTPLECGYVPYRTSTLGTIAYLPIFAITNVQVIYRGGRRSRSSKSCGNLSILISCKDVRVMRIEIDGSPLDSEEKVHKLVSTIQQMADNSQRYRRVVGNSNVLADTLITKGNVSGHSSPVTPPNAAVLGGTSIKMNMESSSNFREISSCFAFSYLEEVSASIDGWNLYSEDKEFKRQIGNNAMVQSFLQLCQNENGAICSSYPSKILLPSSVSHSTVTKVANFRAKNRLPAITYYHRRNRCVLTRSGQPLLGNLLSGTSSSSDQHLVGVYRRFPEIISNQSHESQSPRPIYIFDARKLKASTGNRLMGKGGVETPQDYPGAIICHLNIANMYRMQSSYLSLMKVLLPGGISDQDKTWLSTLESTRWLSHIRLILEGALKIARVLELEGSSVLVHCSDGWDRTTQLVSLAQLMIDPYYRTIRGFAVLVEKDWCAFGHKFAERLGGDRRKDPYRGKSSPVMLQFLDAVWQIHHQFPYAFEFNERFLLHIANSLTSGLYGTFLYDSRLQRDLNEVRKRTVSLWTPVLSNVTSYSNPEYTAWDKPIWPWTSGPMIRLWEGFFLQWHPKFYDCRWISSLVYDGHPATAGRTKSQSGDDDGPRRPRSANDSSSSTTNSSTMSIVTC